MQRTKWRRHSCLLAGTPARVMASCTWLAAIAFSQVVAPPEIRDPALRELQQQHMTQLKAVASAIAAHQFPYPFYFSRTLDLDEKQQATHDQRSIQFAKYGHETVVEVLGNYYAAYSAVQMKKEERARRTFTDVMLPILQAEVPQLQSEESIQGFALEISHHVRKKTLGVSGEFPENVVLVIPKAAAVRLIAAKDEAGQATALAEASVFINREPADLWAGMDPEPEQPAAPPQAPPAPASAAPVAPAVPAAPPPTPDSLNALQKVNQPTLDKLVHELDKTAHFVGYAPPVFIEFHQGAYLQLSLTTTLKSADPGSQYRAAAVAFDEHIAHLIRPVVDYFKDDPKFAGIDFSTTVKPAGQAVEFIFSLGSLRCYEQYDCTGQQIINSGFVLINGERVNLDLQSAER